MEGHNRILHLRNISWLTLQRVDKESVTNTVFGPQVSLQVVNYRTLLQYDISIIFGCWRNKSIVMGKYIWFKETDVLLICSLHLTLLLWEFSLGSYKIPLDKKQPRCCCVCAQLKRFWNFAFWWLLELEPALEGTSRYGFYGAGPGYDGLWASFAGSLSGTSHWARLHCSKSQRKDRTSLLALGF